MTNDYETIADIVADIRAQNQGLPEGSYALSPQVCDLLSLADRIEAAAKREREDGAEAAQICGEIGEMLGRELSKNQSVTECNRLGNAAKMREALINAYYAMFRFIKTKYAEHEEMSIALDVLKAAIDEPPRNCDRPECATTKEAQEVWLKEDGGKTAYYEWLLDTYTKGGAK